MNRWMTRFALPGKCGGRGASGDRFAVCGFAVSSPSDPSRFAKPSEANPIPERRSISRREICKSNITTEPLRVALACRFATKRQADATSIHKRKLIRQKQHLRVPLPRRQRQRRTGERRLRRCRDKLQAYPRLLVVRVASIY